MGGWLKGGKEAEDFLKISKCSSSNKLSGSSKEIASVWAPCWVRAQHAQGWGSVHTVPVQYAERHWYTLSSEGIVGQLREIFFSKWRSDSILNFFCWALSFLFAKERWNSSVWVRWSTKAEEYSIFKRYKTRFLKDQSQWWFPTNNTGNNLQLIGKHQILTSCTKAFNNCSKTRGKGWCVSRTARRMQIIKYIFQNFLS